MLSYCTLHQKPTKFICNSPCSSLFCTECIPFHRNHIIRDLINFPLDSELNSLNQSKQNILKNEQQITQKIENSQKMLKKIEDSQIQALLKIDEDYRNVQKVLCDRVKTVKNEIIEKNSQEKMKVNRFIEECQKERLMCDNKLQIIEKLLRSRPDCILTYSSLLDPSLNAPIKLPSLPKFNNTDLPLLRNPAAFFESI